MGLGEEELAELESPLCIPGDPVKGQSPAAQYWGERSAGILGCWRHVVRRARLRGWCALRPPARTGGSGGACAAVIRGWGVAARAWCLRWVTASGEGNHSAPPPAPPP